jgi:hypothetical protein
VQNSFLLCKKQHLVHPFHCLFTKLLLVNITPLLTYQRKILIFKGILAFHVQQLTGVPDFKTKSLYMFLTEKFLLAVRAGHFLTENRSPNRTEPNRSRTE